MPSHDYCMLKKSFQKINFIRISLVQNLDWASEIDKTTPNKYLFISFPQSIFWPKEMATSAFPVE